MKKTLLYLSLFAIVFACQEEPESPSVELPSQIDGNSKIIYKGVSHEASSDELIYFSNSIIYESSDNNTYLFDDQNDLLHYAEENLSHEYKALQRHFSPEVKNENVNSRTATWSDFGIVLLNGSCTSPGATPWMVNLDYSGTNIGVIENISAAMGYEASSISVEIPDTGGLMVLETRSRFYIVSPWPGDPAPLACHRKVRTFASGSCWDILYGTNCGTGGIGGFNNPTSQTNYIKWTLSR